MFQTTNQAEAGAHASVSTWLTPDPHQNATTVVALFDRGLDGIEHVDELRHMDEARCHRGIPSRVL